MNGTGTTISTGSVGIGITSPNERLQIDGGINIGLTSNTNAGSIQWTGTDFQGYDGSSWKSLTGTGGSSLLTGLTDTPAGYGTAGQVLTTNGIDGTQWSDLSGGGVSPGFSVYKTAGQVISNPEEEVRGKQKNLILMTILILLIIDFNQLYQVGIF